MPHSSPAKVLPIRGERQQADPQSQTQDERTPAQPATSVHPVEPEDKKASHQQQRKVLQMNVGMGGHALQHPATPAGQHATDSFTSDAERENEKR